MSNNNNNINIHWVTYITIYTSKYIHTIDSKVR